MNVYRRLTAPELVNLFARIVPDARINKGRDARLLAVLRDERVLSPVQLALGFYTWRDLCGEPDLPSFTRAAVRWLVEDELEAAAELCLRTGADGVLPALVAYLDWRDAGVPDARAETAFREAKTRLEAIVAGTLDRSPTAGDRRARTPHGPRVGGGPGGPPADGSAAR